MDKKIILLLALVSALALSWQAIPNVGWNHLQRDPPDTVPYVNLTRYLGVWYEQALIPVPFQKDCVGSYANYSFNSDESIRVLNVCYRNGIKGQIVGRAYPDPKDTSKSNSKLKVKFVETLDIEGDYWIVRLDEEYTYVVVSGPTYEYLWILARDQYIPESLYKAIYDDLKQNDFPVEKLQRTIR